MEVLVDISDGKVILCPRGRGPPFCIHASVSSHVSRPRAGAYALRRQGWLLRAAYAEDVRLPQQCVPARPAGSDIRRPSGRQNVVARPWSVGNVFLHREFLAFNHGWLWAGEGLVRIWLHVHWQLNQTWVVSNLGTWLSPVICPGT